MDEPSVDTSLGKDPLAQDSPEVWEALVRAIGPARMMVCVRHRLRAAAVGGATAEDLWQETLLHVWRDRRNLEWRGIRSFRAFVLSVVENRVRAAWERQRARKRDGEAPPDELAALGADAPPPVASTTPSRVASHAEEAGRMERALEGLPDDVREVVRQRLFEGRPVDQVAVDLGLGESAVKHRFRKGALLYHQKLGGAGVDA